MGKNFEIPKSIAKQIYCITDNKRGLAIADILLTD